MSRVSPHALLTLARSHGAVALRLLNATVCVGFLVLVLHRATSVSADLAMDARVVASTHAAALGIFLVLAVVMSARTHVRFARLALGAAILLVLGVSGLHTVTAVLAPVPQATDAVVAVAGALGVWNAAIAGLDLATPRG